METREAKILDIAFNLIEYSTVLKCILDWRQDGKSHLVTISNPHSVMLCNRHPSMLQAHQTSDLTLPDGTGIIFAARLLGHKHFGRVTGPMLMVNLCDWGRDHDISHFFYGGGPGVAPLLGARFQKRFPGLRVVGTHVPPFRELHTEENEPVIEKINASKPDILWVGLGAPKQEAWMVSHRAKIRAAAIIGVGAAFDFHSGRVKWAPVWVRDVGMEWAWRLATNPRRMWRRNLDSPIFMIKVLKQRLFMAGTPRFSWRRERHQ